MTSEPTSGPVPPSAMGVAVPGHPAAPGLPGHRDRQHPATAIPFLVVTILGGAPWQVNVVLFVLIMMVATAQWYVRKYSVISGVLRVRSGLVNRVMRIVPITRITAMAAHRSLTQRLIGVWGLKVQSPGDRRRVGVSPRPACPAGGWTSCGSRWSPVGPSSPPRSIGRADPPPSSVTWPGDTPSSMKGGPDVIAVLTTPDMLLAAITNNRIPLIFAAALVIWFRFSQFVPERAAGLHEDTVEPQGIIAVIIALVVVAIVAGVVLGALRLNQFTLIRDGEVMRNTRGLLGKQSSTIPVKRIQAVRIVEGFTRALFGYCIVAGRGGRNRAGQHQPAHAVPLPADRARGRADPPRRARTGPARAGTAAGHPAAGPPDLFHRVARSNTPAGSPCCCCCLPGWWAAAGDAAHAAGRAAGPPPSAGGPMAGRREDRGAALAAAAEPEHRDGAPVRGAEHGMVVSPWKARENVAGFKMKLLLRPRRQDPLHGRHRRAAAAARGGAADRMRRRRIRTAGRRCPDRDADVPPTLPPDGRRRLLPIVLLTLGLPLTAGARISPARRPPSPSSRRSRRGRRCRTRPHPGRRPVPAEHPAGSAARRARRPADRRAPADPCAPTDAAVIATCLSAPLGLAPLPDGHVRAGRRAHHRPHPAGGQGHRAGAGRPDRRHRRQRRRRPAGHRAVPVIRRGRPDLRLRHHGGGQPHHPDRPRRRAEGDLHRHPQGRRAQRRPDRLRRRPEPVRRHRRHREPGAGRRSGVAGRKGVAAGRVRQAGRVQPGAGIADLRVRIHPGRRHVPARRRRRWPRWITARPRMCCCR